MNPDTGRFEVLRHVEQLEEQMILSRGCGRRAVSRRLQAAGGLPQSSELVRPDGSPVPAHWAIFTAGELVAFKGHTFRVAYINEATLILEPVKPEDALTPP